VKFKPISGKEDQAGGIVWRAKDANNYYVVRANALEGNVVLYKTVNGTRSSLDFVGQKGGYSAKVYYCGCAAKRSHCVCASRLASARGHGWRPGR
jgi:hypothetical protein